MGSGRQVIREEQRGVNEGEGVQKLEWRLNDNDRQQMLTEIK